MFIDTKKIKNNDYYAERIKKIAESENEYVKNILKAAMCAGGIREDVLAFFEGFSADMDKALYDTFINLIFMGDDADDTWYKTAVILSSKENAQWYYREIIKFAGKASGDQILDIIEKSDDKADSPLKFRELLKEASIEKNENSEIIASLREMKELLIQSRQEESKTLTVEEDTSEIHNMEMTVNFYKKSYQELYKKYGILGAKMISLSAENRNLKTQYEENLEELAQTVSKYEECMKKVNDREEATARLAESEYMKAADGPAENEDMKVTDGPAENEDMKVTARLAESEDIKVTDGLAEDESKESVMIDVSENAEQKKKRIGIFASVLMNIRKKSFEKMTDAKKKEKIFMMMNSRGFDSDRMKIITEALKAGVKPESVYCAINESSSDDELKMFIEYYEMEYGDITENTESGSAFTVSAV